MLSSTMTRVFFALWPDDESAARLHEIAHQWQGILGGRVMRQDTLHTTLVFIGNVSPLHLPELQESAAGLDAAAFRLQFDQPGCWRHNHIAYLGMRQIPDALQRLQLDLATRLQAADFKLEQRPFRPHITLLRKANCGVAIKENPAAEPVAWTVRDFVLVKSSMSANGSRYEQIGRWPLL